jgi:prevent-host-death family protein
MDKIWQLQEAESRFAEVVEHAQAGEVQVVTKRGEKAVVVINYERYLELSGQTKGLLEVLRGEPPYTEELLLERDMPLGGEVRFE